MFGSKKKKQQYEQMLQQQQQQPRQQQKQPQQPNKPLSIEEQIAMETQAMQGKGTRTALKVVGIIVGLIVIGIVGFIAGSSTGSANTRAAMTEQHDLEVLQYLDDITFLETQLEEADRVEQVGLESTIQSITVDGETKNAIFLRDGQFIAPHPLEIPTTSVDINQSRVTVGSRFTVRPTESWYTVVKGNEIELINTTQNVWGKIKAFTQKERIRTLEEMEGIIQSFFTGIPLRGNGQIRTSKISIGDGDAGIMAVAPVQIFRQVGESAEGQGQLQSRDMMMAVGFAQRSDYSIQFLFLYDDTGTGIPQEMVRTLLGTVMYSDEVMRLE